LVIGRIVSTGQAYGFVLFAHTVVRMGLTEFVCVTMYRVDVCMCSGPPRPAAVCVFRDALELVVELVVGGSSYTDSTALVSDNSAS